MLDKWIKSWDRPIGALIEDFVDFDKETVAQIQAELLALHKQQQETILSPQEQTNLFNLLGQGRDAILSSLEEWSIGEDNIAAARKEVDSAVGMPAAVPSFGMIAKISRMVDTAVCDELLTVQAAARIIKHISMDPRNAPSLDDAANDRVYGFIGKNKYEPSSLVEAQCYAHISLIYKAAQGSGTQDPATDERLASVANTILHASAERLQAMGIEDAALDIEQSALRPLSDMPLPTDDRINRDGIRLAVGYLVSATDSDAGQSVPLERFRLLAAIQNPPGGGYLGADIPRGPQML